MSTSTKITFYGHYFELLLFVLQFNAKSNNREREIREIRKFLPVFYENMSVWNLKY